MRLRNLFVVVALVAGGGWAWLFAPHFLDEVRMKDCAAQAVTNWVAWNDVDRARREFDTEAQRRGLPDSLGSALCEFEEEDDDRIVDCAWEVDVTIPIVDQTRRLGFHVREVAAPDGRLRD